MVAPATITLPPDNLAVVTHCPTMPAARKIGQKTTPMGVVWVIGQHDYWCVWGGKPLTKHEAKVLQAHLYVQYRIKTEIKPWFY